MPELPEVQTVVDALTPNVINQKINSINFTDKGLSALASDQSQEFVSQKLTGATITNLKRIGKFIIFETDKHDIVNHLRMTGRFIFEPNPLDKPMNTKIVPAYFVSDASLNGKGINDPYIRFSMKLSNGNLHFSDKRRFGTFHLIENYIEYPSLQKLGPDAVSGSFTADYLKSSLSKRNKPIYSALLDQYIVAGLGNIYVCESLAYSKIHPLRKSLSITKDELNLLVENIKQILNKAIEYEGTSFSDFKHPDQHQGGFQNQLLVYGKKSTELNHEQFKVEKVKIGGRSAYFIPEIQKI